MTFCGAIGSLFLKKATNTDKFHMIATNINLYIGGVIYFIGAGLNIYILRFIDYSVALPLTALTYVWTMVVSRLVLKEKLSRQKILGIVCVLIGAILVSLK